MERWLKWLRLHPDATPWWFLYAVGYLLFLRAASLGLLQSNGADLAADLLLSAAMGLVYASAVTERRHGPQMPPPTRRAMFLFAVATTVVAALLELGAQFFLAFAVAFGTTWLVDAAIDSLARPGMARYR